MLLHLQLDSGRCLWLAFSGRCAARHLLLHCFALHRLDLPAGIGDDFLGDLQELLERGHFRFGVRIHRQIVAVLGDVLVKHLHDRQDLHRINGALLNASNELLQQRGVHADVHAVEFAVEHRHRLSGLHRLVLHQRDLRIDSHARLRCRWCVAVHQIAADALGRDVAHKVTPADLVVGSGDLVELTQREQTVGSRTSTDRAHRTGLFEIE